MHSIESDAAVLESEICGYHAWWFDRVPEYSGPGARNLVVETGAVECCCWDMGYEMYVFVPP